MADTKADKPCTVLISYEESEPPQLIEIKKQLETGSPQDKIDTMKRVILLMLNGENMAQLLMPIIRFVMTLDDKKIKKLVLLFLEIVEKTTADGKLLPEMILVWYVSVARYMICYLVLHHHYELFHYGYLRKLCLIFVFESIFLMNLAAMLSEMI